MDDRDSLTETSTRHAVCRTLMFGIMLGVSFLTMDSVVLADQPQWIWTPKKTGAQDLYAQGDCHFRKKFTLVRPDNAEMEIAAGDEYEVFVNGRLVTRGQSYGSTTKLDIAGFLYPGVNLIAAKVRHHDGSHVGLAMRIRIKERGETRWRSLVTDATWKTRIDSIEDWKNPGHNDMGWLKAQTIGSLESAVAANQADQTKSKHTPAPPTSTIPEQQMTRHIPVGGASTGDVHPAQLTTQIEPTSNPVQDTGQRATGATLASAPTTKGSVAKSKRFDIDPEFSVQKVLAGDETGSLIAMEFNEFGQLLLSREGGPLLIADPTRQLNDPQRVRVYCDQVDNCQGILALNGEVFVTGNGPQGLGLYRLADIDQNGKMEVQQKIAGFTGTPSEHGPHGLQLGPDGLLYVVIGNGSRIEASADTTSPYQHYYEGELVPRYEDPGGHAKGVKAPGGTIVRVSLDGQRVETVAGGIRNAYDLAFDHLGEMFIHDSDMESEIGTTWYRPTMVYHVTAGAELGWRSGWAKFAQYFTDQTPAVCETGRGSPSGAVLYQHLKFPEQYQDALFFADWSEGRILSLKPQRQGSGYVATAETFLKGRPLNVVDLAVGEDGALYFCTGGRGTEGGVYRVIWNGDISPKLMEFESELAKAIRHPQPNSAWARQNIAKLKIVLGTQWDAAIEGVAQETRNKTGFRIRALQLMVLHGPAPTEALLSSLSSDESEEIRAQVALLCGLKNDEPSHQLLNKLIADESALVRRKAGEGMMRSGMVPELSALLPMLSSLDRIESLCARRLLERMPAEQWESAILETEDKRLFNQGAVALMTADPTLERAYSVLAKASKFMEGFINDHDFINLLRTMQLALVRGEVDPALVPGLAKRMANEFPSGSPKINRELVRLLAYLKAGDLNGRIENMLQDEQIPREEKVHLGMYFQAIGSDLTPSARLAIIDFLEQSQGTEGVGGSYDLYLQQAVKDIAKSITPEQLDQVFENGHRWPNAVVAAFYQLPETLDPKTVQRIIEMDKKFMQADGTDRASQQARLGVIAILARNGDAESMDYLRMLWREEEPRRNDLVIGLSQQPEAENWPYLVSSLPNLDDLTGAEIVEKLTSVPRRPREPQHFRDLITVGYRLRGQDNNATVHLLEHWAGQQLTAPQDDWQSKLDVWKTWFQQNWPDEAPITMEAPNQVVGKYSVAQLLTQLETMGPGNRVLGHAAFVKAQCATCHQMNGQGQSVGPDLTNLPQRFSLRETIEATVDPSKVISDRYASKTVLTQDGMQFSGMTVSEPDGSYVVHQSDGKRIRINADDVDEVRPSSQSVMPEGLLDSLTASEINHLFAYLLGESEKTANQEKETPLVSQSEFSPSR